MLLANPHEEAVFKSLYFSIIHMFISERKYVPIRKSTNVGLEDLNSVHCLSQSLMWSGLSQIYLGGDISPNSRCLQGP